jgi:hypothetical protein
MSHSGCADNEPTSYEIFVAQLTLKIKWMYVPAQHPMSISSHFVVRKLSVFIVVCIT